MENPYLIKIQKKKENNDSLSYSQNPEKSLYAVFNSEN